MYCIHCGLEIDYARTCPKCSKPQIRYCFDDECEYIFATKVNKSFPRLIEAIKLDNYKESYEILTNNERGDAHRIFRAAETNDFEQVQRMANYIAAEHAEKLDEKDRRFYEFDKRVELGKSRFNFSILFALLFTSALCVHIFMKDDIISNLFYYAISYFTSVFIVFGVPMILVTLNEMGVPLLSWYLHPSTSKYLKIIFWLISATAIYFACSLI